MLNRLQALTFVMIAIGALYAFDGLSHGALSANSITGLSISDQTLSQQDVSCYDSDGRDYYSQGTVYARLFQVNGEEPQQDMCVGNSLIEYYCVFNEVQVEFHDCVNGCANGACS